MPSANPSDKPLSERIALCSGKVYYDLLNARGEDKHVALIRVEQLYPFPASRMKEVIATFPKAREVVWCQEEPANMGAWSFMRPHLESLDLNLPIRYVGRPPSASPAIGFYAIHELEQKKLVMEALTIK